MNHAVQHQDFDFIGGGMSKLTRVVRSNVGGDGEVTGEIVGDGGQRRERQNISGFVLAAVTPVQGADLAAGGDQDIDLATQSYRSLGAGQKTAQSPLADARQLLA